MLDELFPAGPDTEIWWDALPSMFPAWRDRLPEAARSGFRDPDGPGQGLFTGATTNWRLVLDAIAADPARWTPDTPEQSFEDVCLQVFRREAALLRTLWESSEGRHGWVCAQLPPGITLDAEAMTAAGLRYAAAAPNLMVKVPASKAGITAIENLTACGVATNATLSFSVAQARAGVAAVQRGLLRGGSAPPSRWRAVHSFMAGRVGPTRSAEMAVFRHISEAFRTMNAPVTLLLCSVKRDDDGGCTHLEQAIGAAGIITLPPSFLASMGDAGPNQAEDFERRPDFVTALGEQRAAYAAAAEAVSG